MGKKQPMKNESKIRNLNLEMNDIPKCNILGVDLAAVNMMWTIDYLKRNIQNMSGKYICVTNVHTTVMSYENEEYRFIQNNGVLALPDGGPLSTIGRKKGFKGMERVTGPNLMEEIFKVSVENDYTHYFYGSSEDTLKKLNENLLNKYPKLNIVGMHSPPYRELTIEEDMKIISNINDLSPDFIWVGLGAPKQENWMAQHQDKVSGLMIGVGAGFDYFAGKIKRAPKIMQKANLEWLFRLLQDPSRLFKRYLRTNSKFIWLVMLKEIK